MSMVYKKTPVSLIVPVWWAVVVGSLSVGTMRGAGFCLMSNALFIHDSGKIEKVAPGTIAHASIWGTHLQGVMDVDYQKLVQIFGEPDLRGSDDFKSDAQWILMTEAGIATIYNYKNGKNYLGEEGLEVERITEWHIGGHTPAVVEKVKVALGID